MSSIFCDCYSEFGLSEQLDNEDFDDEDESDDVDKYESIDFSPHFLREMIDIGDTKHNVHDFNNEDFVNVLPEENKRTFVKDVVRIFDNIKPDELDVIIIERLNEWVRIICPVGLNSFQYFKHVRRLFYGLSQRILSGQHEADNDQFVLPDELRRHVCI